MNSTAIATRDPSSIQTRDTSTHLVALSAEAAKEHVQAVQQVMRAVMFEGTHYGKIPGAGDKPTLLKPGAEVLCLAFHIYPQFDVEDLSTGDGYRYRVKCRGVHQSTGIVLGEGIGSASSNEEKYKWERAVCDAEWDNTPETRRRTKYGKKNAPPGYYTVKQIRVEPDDIDNTVLKMAQKRAHIAMTLNALAASDIFTQDLEDEQERVRRRGGGGDEEGGGAGGGGSTDAASGGGDGGARTGGGSSDAQAAATPMPKGMLEFVRKKLETAKVKEPDACRQFGIEKLEGQTVKVGRDMIAWCDAGAKLDTAGGKDANAKPNAGAQASGEAKKDAPAEQSGNG